MPKVRDQQGSHFIGAIGRVAAVIKRFRDRFLRKKSGAKGVRVKNKRMTSLAKSLERYAEAAGIAQAGAQDFAQDIIRREIQERPKILVVGSRDGFPRPLVEYAVSFAKRMAYEIVALNFLPIEHKGSEVLTPQQKQLFKEFKNSAAKGVEPLARRAGEEEVPFRHVVKVGSLKTCVRELNEEISRLNLVLTESESTPKEGLETSIPVFSLMK